jgi:mRNA-degrading endonuclease toxin of MazEF toxin-antitoxin module
VASHEPRAGEVWDVDFDPRVGREQGGVRPALVISNDTFNQVPNGLHMVDRSLEQTGTSESTCGSIRLPAGSRNPLSSCVTRPEPKASCASGGVHSAGEGVVTFP